MSFGINIASRNIGMPVRSDIAPIVAADQPATNIRYGESRMVWMPMKKKVRAEATKPART